MCGTCGCGSEENGVNIRKPGEIEMHEHHEHEHHHHDDHTHSHPHSHSHHHHSHEKNNHHKTIIEIEQNILQQNDIRLISALKTFRMRKRNYLIVVWKWCAD